MYKNKKSTLRIRQQKGVEKRCRRNIYILIYILADIESVMSEKKCAYVDDGKGYEFALSRSDYTRTNF
nr:MAG TPA: hypothetical protein [Caudoviricetes sp.]